MIRRLLADADLKGAIAAGVVRRNSSIDFKRAEDVPLEGLEDPNVSDSGSTREQSSSEP